MKFTSKNRCTWFDNSSLKKEARDYVAILLEMYLLCPTLRNPAITE